MKKALITGVTGQDGSYLAESLLDKGYEVFGLHRRSSVDGFNERIEHLNGGLKLVCGDLLDLCSLEKAVRETMPQEVYNLGAQSQVRQSFDQPHLTNEVNWLGVERLLDIVKRYAPNAKFYQASTSEMFGDVIETPQNENTLFNPVSPYGKSKLKAHKTVLNARQEGLFACSGILFNHESPKRGLEFVTRKFTDGITRIKLGLPQRITGRDHLEVGNLNAKRDWGYAPDYVNAMWMMLQQDKPDDYVIATGESHTVREFLELAANSLEIEIKWQGDGFNEEGYDSNGKKIIVVNKDLFRPVEVNTLRGDSSNARKKLGWKPKTKFDELVKIMALTDYERLKNK